LIIIIVEERRSGFLLEWARGLWSLDDYEYVKNAKTG
jgi:hypothetical protein